jgi:hypothetical protein
MANGYCEALLLHLESIAGINYPGKKVTVPGFLNMLITQPDRPFAAANVGGHYKDVRVKYMPRTTTAQVSTDDTCSVDFVPAYLETTVAVEQVAQTGVWVSDDVVRQYCEDASRTVAVGVPATQLMTEHLNSILHAMNGIYQKMEDELTDAVVFGTHQATGTAAAVTVNIEQDGTLNDLATGLTKLLMDAQVNEFCGNPLMVGPLGSRFHAFDLQKQYNALSPATGYDPAMLAMNSGYQFFASGFAGANFGNANALGMFAPGSAHLIERLDNVGSFAGQRGSSFFTTIIDPRTQCWTPNGLSNIQFDLQVKYIDCPDDLGRLNGGGAIDPTTLTAARGYALIIKKRYDLFQTPTNAYDAADRLTGNNGALLYTITNS